jgi:hypothetical protein
MCKPDLSLLTFHWINETAQHEDQGGFFPNNIDVSMHTCAKWDMIDEWAGDHVFNLFDIDQLERPTPNDLA